MQNIVAYIDKLNTVVGKVICILIFPIIFAMIIEVVTRYFFRVSQLWVPETSMFLFGAMFTLAGGYTYLCDGHVRMDVIYNLLSSKIKSFLNILSFIPLIIYCSVILFEGSKMAYDAFVTLEKSASAFAPYLFPIKVCIPLGAFLLIVQGFAKLIRDIIVFKMEVKR